MATGNDKYVDGNAVVGRFSEILRAEVAEAELICATRGPSESLR